MHDLNDVDPKEQDLHADALEIVKAVSGDGAGDGGLVAELVRVFNGEATFAAEVRRELAGGGVKVVAGGALGEEADGEAVGLENIVGRWFGDVGER